MTPAKPEAKAAKAKASSAPPKLLSGGNPQIAKADGDAPVQAYIAAMPEWKQEVGKRIDELVTATMPRIRKAVRWNSPFYGMPGNGWFLSFHCFDRYVKVSFLNGAVLEPQPPVPSKVAGVRYLHVAAADEIDNEQFVAWIRQAAESPGDHLF